MPYPTACSPQAWAAGTPLALVRAMLDLQAVDGRLTMNPDIPPEIERIASERIGAFGHRWEIEAVGRSGYVRLSGT
ncbi:hypothetical protein AB0I37_12060 [Micromonospora purpureochromogenes]|uniref:hypothetical protein n=1 Tax=Micromonospora purpureochromogenes TaxID=47872 RepID=UPI0033D1D0A6